MDSQSLITSGRVVALLPHGYKTGLFHPKRTQSADHQHRSNLQTDLLVPYQHTITSTPSLIYNLANMHRIVLTALALALACGSHAMPQTPHEGPHEADPRWGARDALPGTSWGKRNTPSSPPPSSSGWQSSSSGWWSLEQLARVRRAVRVATSMTRVLISPS